MSGTLGDGWETKTFPEDLCVNPTNEPEVFESNQAFLCIIGYDAPDVWSLRVLYPYIVRTGDQVTLYGWANASNHYLADHNQNGIHGYSDKVIAWKPVEKGFSVLNGVAHDS